MFTDNRLVAPIAVMPERRERNRIAISVRILTHGSRQMRDFSVFHGRHNCMTGSPSICMRHCVDLTALMRQGGHEYVN